ncbi:MAG: Ig-like domain-containing protein [Euryarchaeota archaeon]|nr:Ig-like domain-containing protein [Euryarchaeota archaeon]
MHASDADGDTLTLSALGLPAGSMFTTTPANDSAYVAWTPGFGQSGSYVVTLRASDGNLTTAVAVGIVVEDFPDHEAPVTSAAITSGTQSPSGWYTTNAEVTLTPADAGGSGLKSTYYRYNGGNRIGYNPSTRINVPSEGTTVISYWSEDNNGNLEAEKTITVRIDRLAPTVTITSPTGVFGTDIATTEGGTVNFTISANDGSGSGIGQVRFFVDGVLVKVDTSAGPYYYNWNAGAATTGRHVLSVKVVDNVGILVEKSISVVKLT